MNKNNLGFSLIELLVAVTFVSVITLMIVNVTFFNTKLSDINDERVGAIFYLNDGAEKTKLMSWDVLEYGDYHPVLSGNTWVLASSSETLDDKYTRTINISTVERASSTENHVYGPIVPSGYVDPNTKKITISVSWVTKNGGTKEESVENYLHRWQASRWVQTDWSGGPSQSQWYDETRFDYDSDGIDWSLPGVVSLQSGYIDWSQATTTDVFDTAGNFADNDVVESDGIAYLVTENNPSAPELYLLDVTDVYNISQISSFDVGASVTSVAKQGNYVYLSTGDNAAEFQIIDVTDVYNPALIGSYDLASNDDAYDVDINDTKAFVVQGDTLYSFDITNPSSPILLDDIDIGYNGTRIDLSEDYIYIATLDADKELQIINVTNPASMSASGTYDLPGSLKGTDVHVRGTRAFISTQNNGSGSEFFIIDVTDPDNPSHLGHYDVDETIHSFSIVGPYIMMGTNFLDEELLVLDVTDPTSILFIIGFDVNGYILGMSANCSVIYAASSSNLEEFFIVSTGVTDCDYASTGTLESSTFDTGSDYTVYNWISWQGTTPLDTTIRFQLASSNNASGPWYYVGPDGTASTYYTVGTREFINYAEHVNDRYMRYKLYLDSEADLQVPTLDEVIISYSPE